MAVEEAQRHLTLMKPQNLLILKLELLTYLGYLYVLLNIFEHFACFLRVRCLCASSTAIAKDQAEARGKIIVHMSGPNGFRVETV